MRTRVRPGPEFAGFRDEYNGFGDYLGRFYYEPTSLGYEQCDDEMPGWNSGAPFYVDRFKRGTISYVDHSSSTAARLEQTLAHPSATLTHLDPIECGAPYSYSPEYLATLIAARTNPSRPDVSLYQFLGEMRDLPKKVFEKGIKGQNWAKEENSAIATRFGILPFVNDVLKMTQFQKSFEKRAKEFHRLVDGKGLLRRVRLGRFKGGYELDSALPVIYADEDKKFRSAYVTHWDLWGTCRWRPGSDSIFTSTTEDSRDRIAMIEALLRGTSQRNDIISYARDAWELVPWSWLSDWFLNVGDFLDANRNQNIAEISELYVMAYAVTVQRDQGPLGTVESYRETKMRTQQYPTLTAVGSYIGPDQIATLHSLATNNPRHQFPRKFR